MKRTPTLRVDDHEWLCLMEISSLLAETLHQSEESITASRRTIGRALEQWISEGRLHPLEPETLNPWDHQTDEVPGYFVLERSEVENFAQAHGVTLTRVVPNPILISDRLEAITVGRAKELIIDAADCPNEVCEDGMTALEAFVESVEQDFLRICEELAIQLFSPHNTKVAEVSVGANVDNYQMSRESFIRYANHYGSEVVTPPEGSTDRSDSESRRTHIPSSTVSHTHSTKTRTYYLDHIIQLAQKNSVDRWNTHSVWAELIKLATSPQPPPPVLGFAPEEGVKYLKSDGDTTEFFTKNALDQYMRRRRPGADQNVSDC